MKRIAFFASSLVFLILLSFSLPVGAIDNDDDFDLLPYDLEIKYGTDPTKTDTDGDGIEDGIEVLRGTDPLSPPIVEAEARLVDTDTDGLNDWLEHLFQTDPTNYDTDGDSFSDYTEVMHGYSPLIPKADARLSQKLIVNLNEQQLAYHVNEIAVKHFPVSTGKLSTPTPTGTFAVQRKIPVARYRAFDYDIPNVKWNMQFIPRYFIHTAYWHNQFGVRPMSHGCVNMKEADAKFLYEHIGVGVPVEVIGKTPVVVAKK